MKSSVLITIITATSMVRGATLMQTHADPGADQHLRNGTRSNADKRVSLNAPTCPTNGFNPLGLPSCVCNFAGACDPTTNAPTAAAKNDLTNLGGIAPRGMNTFAQGTSASLGTVCEEGVVAALYDCNARSSLYAATVLDAKKIVSVKREDLWKGTTDTNLLPHGNLLGSKDDYAGSSNHKYCYEDNVGNEYEWDGLSSCAANKPRFSIHKGHMIAARYGGFHGNKAATFTYTNAVPQEGSFNSPKWRDGEGKMYTMAITCETAAQAKSKTTHAITYVVVGVVPSTYLEKPRFFGSGGFGNFQGASANKAGGSFKISVPEIMWTAGCCIHTDGTIGDRFAFWRRNRFDRTDPVKEKASAALMFTDIATEISTTWGIKFDAPTVFPGEPGCD